MTLINTTHGLKDESELMKLPGLVDSDDEHTTTVEYCLLNCPGDAHKTGVPDSASHFCNQHVHRSVHVTLKKAVTAESIADSFA
jgi:hypothetical protein